jgi:hypothetical protein
VHVDQVSSPLQTAPYGQRNAPQLRSDLCGRETTFSNLIEISISDHDLRSPNMHTSSLRALHPLHGSLTDELSMLSFH